MRTAILGLVLAVAACGSPVSTPTPSPTEASTPASATRQTFPSPPISDSPVPSANGWVTFTNRSGQFTVSVPAAWRATSCEDQASYLVAVVDPPVGCGRDEYYDAWLFAMSLAGDQRQAVPPAGGNYTGLAPVTGSKDVVTAGGVHGIRYTATVVKDGMIGTPKGTTQIYYLFFNGARTYFFLYSRLPGQTDVSTEFDVAIQQRLKLGA